MWFSAQATITSVELFRGRLSWFVAIVLKQRNPWPITIPSGARGATGVNILIGCRSTYIIPRAQMIGGRRPGGLALSIY